MPGGLSQLVRVVYACGCAPEIQRERRPEQPCRVTVTAGCDCPYCTAFGREAAMLRARIERQASAQPTLF